MQDTKAHSIYHKAPAAQALRQSPPMAVLLKYRLLSFSAAFFPPVKKIFTADPIICAGTNLLSYFTLLHICLCTLNKIMQRRPAQKNKYAGSNSATFWVTPFCAFCLKPKFPSHQKPYRSLAAKVSKAQFKQLRGTSPSEWRL